MVQSRSSLISNTLQQHQQQQQQQQSQQSANESNNATAAAAAAAAAANSYASTFRNVAMNGLHPYAASYEAAAAAAAACAWAGRLDPSSASLGRLDAASAAGFQAGLAASQAAAFRRSGKCMICSMIHT